MSKISSLGKLTSEQSKILIQVLKKRFEQNMHRHKSIQWADVQKKLEANPYKMWSLQQMEDSEGEPDVIAYNKKTNEYTFIDCSPESPKGRRSLCYDQEALESRKENKPKDSAMKKAHEMGINLLTEEEYRHLQKIEELDLKTSSWILTPEKIRKLGGALFCDRRFDTVFTYHNGAESYYAARGFRGLLIV